MTVASKIADFIWDINYVDIPNNVKDLAKRALIDYVAATSIGAKANGSEVIKRYVAEKPQNDECKAIRVNGYFTMEDAALMNGYFAHLLDYDDAGLTGHPSAVLMSTCFAVGETLAISGEELMTAYILGYEVSLKIADALMPELTGRGVAWNACVRNYWGGSVRWNDYETSKRNSDQCHRHRCHHGLWPYGKLWDTCETFSCWNGCFQWNKIRKIGKSWTNGIASGNRGKMRLRKTFFRKIHNRGHDTVWR